MPADMNSVHLIGRLTRDPELRSLPSGSSVCSMRVACTERTKNGSTGEWEDRPNYFDVTVWGNQAENCAKWLAKGRQIGVAGRLRWREYTDKEGNKRQAVDINAFHVQFLSIPKDDDGGQRRSGGYEEPEIPIDTGDFKEEYGTQAGPRQDVEEDIPFVWRPEEFDDRYHENRPTFRLW